MIFQRKKNTIFGLLQFYYNFNKIWRKIKLTPSLVFLSVILLAAFLSLISMGGFGSALENLAVFLLLGAWFVFMHSYSYDSVRKKSDIYRLEAVDLSQDGFLIFYDNHPAKKEVLYKDILKLSFAGYPFVARIGIWYMHYVIDYMDSEGKNKKLLVPLDITGLPEFLKSIIVEAGLIKVKPSQFSFVYEWRKLNAGENLKAVGSDDLNPCVLDPNKNL